MTDEPEEFVLQRTECPDCNMPVKAVTIPGTKKIAEFACTVCPFTVKIKRVPKPGCDCAECKRLIEGQR